jgi:methionyl-tRNA formyltransferase
MTRAYTPWPSAYTFWQGAPFKVWQARLLAGQAAPGEVVQTPQGVAVGTGAGLLLLVSVQPAGKRRMDAASFVNGAPGFVGSILDSNQEGSDGAGSGPPGEGRR